MNSQSLEAQPEPELASEAPSRSMKDILDRTRRSLLETGLRNRLINTPLGKAKSKRLDVVDERSDEVFRILVSERKAMSFNPAEGEDAVESEKAVLQLEQPDDEDDVADRHKDTKLQTRLSSESLQKRLLDLYYDAETFIEEQGVSILYLAMGFLEWYEADSSDQPRYAPLLLIPVDLERVSAGTKFKVNFRDEDFSTNLSLDAKLQSEFKVVLPPVPDLEELTPSQYFAQVAAAIETKRRWRVLENQMTVWFFSFAKYLMYRDLDATTWPEGSPLDKNATLSKVLRDGFSSLPPICGDDQLIDDVIPPPKTLHVTDADSSQAIVIEEVRRGRSLVVQGPPGTGKSQTITNVIAAAIKEGKRVLFVAEKLAALEVVKGRLDRLNLGPMCLELHSHKANKKAVLSEIDKTLKLGRPKVANVEEHCQALAKSRERLNRHSAYMNSPLGNAGVSPFQVLGRIARIRARGSRSAPFNLNGCHEWAKGTFDEHRQRLRDLEGYLKELGALSDHPWKGVAVEIPLLPSDQERIAENVEALNQSLAKLVQSSQQLAAALNIKVSDDPSLHWMRTLADLGSKLSDCPDIDPTAIASPVWEQKSNEIGKLAARAARYADSKRQLDGVVSEIAWQTDLATTRREIAAHGKSWFRWLNGRYREAIANLRGVLQVDLPKGHAERLKIVDAIIASRTEGGVVDGPEGELGREAFGSFWKGTSSDFEAIARITAWEKGCREAQIHKAFRQLAAKLRNRPALTALVTAVDESLQQTLIQLDRLKAELKLDLGEAFGNPNLQQLAVATIRERGGRWQLALEQLSKWVGYRVRREQLIRSGLGTVVECLESGKAQIDALVDQFSQAYFERLLKVMFENHPDFREFDGPTFERWIDDFRKLDHGRIQLARAEVALAHFGGMPVDSERGEMAIIRREIEKKRNQLAIRRLLKEAGHAIQGIKPVFMMSPISIAQFLEPGLLKFDLLVMDEASQVTPADALGAMARAEQLVVVGDSKQLPPSRFFSKMLDDGDTEDEDAPADAIKAADLESVLGLCVAQGLPQRMLRWHYRSRHHSLIAVSNREFYDSNLYVVPSPSNSEGDTGLKFRHIKDGVFDRGRAACNRIEARAVAKAIIEHARERPDKSLGVATFSVSQRDAIRDELELLLRNEGGNQAFFAAGGPEPMFIKNLENVQGDERDVIFISVGYARDASGYMSMGFGPLSGEGGERRMNVLISRARECCEVFSSIRADDLRIEGAAHRGSTVLKTFLRYAETGILDSHDVTGKDFDSDFEIQVAEAIARHGYKVDHQIGSAGFKIDLAVVDPDRPGRYLMGIECDGATYHSSRWARDRDRLREQVLVDRGWTIHRIWSTDWFHRPDEQIKKVLLALEQAKSRGVSEARPAPVTPAEPAETIQREASSAMTDEVPSAAGYVEASFAVPTVASIPDTNSTQLAGIVRQIVDIEAPIHRDEIGRRIMGLWGVSRMGNRITEAVDRAIAAAEQKRLVQVDDADFVTPVGFKGPAARNRANVQSANLRKAEFISIEEAMAAVRQLVERSVGISRQEAPAAMAEVFGLKSATAAVKQLSQRAIQRLVDSAALTEKGEKLY